MKSIIRTIMLLLGAAAASVTMVAIAGAGTPHEPDLAAVKRATARYHFVAIAERDGYAQASPCEQSPDGAMGYHYANQGLAQDLAVNALHPETILYEPTPHGGLRLVGVEYFVPALANTPSGPQPWFDSAPPPGAFFNAAPMLFGQTFNGPMAGRAPGMPWHYDLHAWIWKSNPSGMFAPWNPRVHCSD